jgi:hypothetical protein
LCNKRRHCKLPGPPGFRPEPGIVRPVRASDAHDFVSNSLQLSVTRCKLILILHDENRPRPTSAIRTCTAVYDCIRVDGPSISPLCTSRQSIKHRQTETQPLCQRCHVIGSGIQLTMPPKMFGFGGIRIVCGEVNKDFQRRHGSSVRSPRGVHRARDNVK